ncbi:hypothetical protein BUALT_Bualt04G0106300 [Buddleja alternifolia]|uniref:Cytochrome P450 n=1 Tax=Buddleja alternifolia TaxID=168488 RepID=A0AAV6XYQ8_9LAMI|nr:hypothetical protein BUALT_Bualt04G0106300 [Buddleja alternifolia]
MEATVLYTSFTLILIFLIFKQLSRKRRHNLPPSPAVALPILGHLHLLKQPLHRTFRHFSQIHGPIFSLQLGFRRVVVVSSPDLVEECFTKNDIVFSNRPRVLVDKYIGYDHTTMAGAPYGHQWRSLRRLGAQEVLSSARLNVFSKIREDEIRRVLQTLIGSNKFEKVKLRPKLFEIIFNMIMRMLAGKRYSGEDKESEEFREMVSEVFEHAQSSNPEDFLPFLLWIDYRGLKKKMADLGKKLDDFYENLLEEHRREKRINTMIGHLLSLQESEPEFYTDQIIKGFITYRLPPSPAVALPILGHLHLLKPPLHRNLHRLSQISGPIFSLKLGFRRVVVVSSPSLVEECFTKNDVVFANRPRILVDKHIGYNHSTMSGGRYGEHWIRLRRIAAQEVLSTTRINALLNIRQDEINRLLLSLHKTSSNQGFTKVQMRPKLSELTFNVMMRMIAGKRYFSEDDTESEQGKKYRNLIYQIFEHSQASNPQDFLPFLQWIDYGGYTKKLRDLAKEMDEFFQSLVDEHRLEKRNTMIGHLISLQQSQPELYSDQTTKGLIMVRF